MRNKADQVRIKSTGKIWSVKHELRRLAVQILSPTINLAFSFLGSATNSPLELFSRRSNKNQLHDDIEKRRYWIPPPSTYFALVLSMIWSMKP